MTTQPRTPAGSPAGGQFASAAGAESGLHLSQPDQATIDDIAAGRAILAHNPTDTGTRDRLLEAEQRLASDMGTSVPELSVLASSRFWAVRDLVAKHPATSDETLHALAEDVSAEVRCSVAGNPNAPKPVMAILVDDSVPVVRATARLHQS